MVLQEEVIVVLQEVAEVIAEAVEAAEEDKSASI